MTTHWTEAIAALQQATSILVVTHVKPDGDAIGSLLGLTLALREKGKQVEAAVDGGVPDFLRYLSQCETVLSELSGGQWDLMIAVDASDVERIGSVGSYGLAHSQQVINLDHHPSNTRFGDIHLIVPEAVSASEIIYDWLLKMDTPPSQPVATALLTGLITDTMGFRTSNVNPRTLQVAHELMLAGGPLLDIVNRTLVTKPFSHILLWQQVFPTIAFKDGIASAVIRPENVKAAELREMTDGGLVNLLVAAEEVAAAVVYKVLDAQFVEISFRSKSGFDVGSVAVALGGGGHAQAAGVTVAGTLDEVQARVMLLLEQAVKQGQAARG